MEDINSRQEEEIREIKLDYKSLKGLFEKPSQIQKKNEQYLQIIKAQKQQILDRE